MTNLKGNIQCPHCHTGGIQPTLEFILRSIERDLGVELEILSGYRCPVYNATLGDSVKNSAHLRGLAVDIKCNDSGFRWRLINKICGLGIKRFGVAKTYIHIDIDDTLPQKVVWEY